MKTAIHYIWKNLNNDSTPRFILAKSRYYR